MCGPNSSSMRPVPVPRSSSERNGWSASASRDRAFDRGVGDMQLADAVPFGRMGAEIGLRRRRARGAHGGEPLAVALDDRIGRIEPRQQHAGGVRPVGAFRHAEERPAAFAEPLDQARLGEQLADGARCAAATGAGSR